MNKSQARGRDWVAMAATAFLVANLLHGADHLRQHLAGVDVAVATGGALLTVAAIVVFRRRRDAKAAPLAAFVGFWAAANVAASHILPHWSTISDSYINDVHPDLFSWAVMLLEVAAALILGVTGLLALGTQPREAEAAP